MNKKELVQSIAQKSGLDLKNATKALDALTASIVKAMKEGESVALVGFGTFIVREVKARQGINPATKQIIVIPAKRVVKFRPGTILKLK